MLTRISHECAWGRLDSGFPCVLHLVANTRAKLACFIAMPEISRAVFCLDIVQIARDAAARRDDAFSRAKDPPSAPFSFPFFLIVPFLLFIVNLFQRDLMIAGIPLESAMESCDTRACAPIFCEKLVANTNYYLSRQIQAAVPLQLINFRAIHLSSVCSGYNWKCKSHVYDCICWESQTAVSNELKGSRTILLFVYLNLSFLFLQ